MHESNPAGFRSEAEAAFFEFLAGQQGGAAADFEAFVAARPGLAAELRQLHRSWTDIQPVLNSLIGGDAAGLSLTRLLESRGQPSRTPPSIAPSLSLRLDEGPPGPAADALMEQLLASAPVVPRYRVESEIGRGGMGTIHRVWDEHLRRQLAMKVIRRAEPAPPRAPPEHAVSTGPEPAAAPPEPAPPDGRSLSRFLDEALVTGQLDHPGIVPVHELGVDAEGRAWFTMKLVKGRNLQHIFELVAAGEDGWTANRAVGVILRVCEAVAYAHSKGVIHRDIKPANVMVGRFGETYLMDWGLARVLQRPEAVVPVASAPPDADDAGPLAPAAPDSWLFSSDGTIIGTPAYMSPEQARGEIEKVDERSDVYSLGALLYHLLTGRVPYIAPGDMPLPFSVLMAVRRGPPTPVRELAPDAPPGLLAVCERAMAREVEDRTASAAAMAAALEDYLEDISAGREEARRQARRAQLINDFLVGMLAAQDPDRAQGREVTVREVLDRASRQIEDALPGQELDEAALRGTIGRLYLHLGQHASAEPHLRRAHELFHGALGEEHPETLSSATDLALLHRGRGRHDEAERLLRATLAHQQRALGGRHADTLRTMDALAGVLHRSPAGLREAEDLYGRAVAGRTETLGERHPDTLSSMNSLALVMLDAGRPADASAMQARVLEVLRLEHGESHPSTLIAMNDLALTLAATGRLDEAEPLCRRALELQRTVFGPTHPHTLATTNNYCMLLERRGRLAEAEALLAETLAAQREHAGDDHLNTLSFMNNLALAIQRQGRPQEAEPLFRESVQRGRAGLAPGHRATARFAHNLGCCLADLGRRDEARAELRAALLALQHELPAEHPWVREAEEALLALATPGLTARSLPPRSSVTARPAPPDR